MTARQTPDSIDEWLDVAARGLPTSISALVHAELRAHYEDAVEDYQMKGKVPLEAGQAALADLGDAGATSSALRETHLARRWYIAAAVVGLLFPVILWLALTIGEPMVPYALGRPIEDVLILSPTIFILFVFRKLLVLRTGTRAFDAPLTALSAALLIQNGSIDLRLALFPGTEHSWWIPDIGSGDMFRLVAIAGLVATGLSLFWLAVRLLDLGNSLYGLRIPIVVTAVILGLAVIAFGMGLLQNATTFATLSDMVVMLADLILMALMALLFFRAAYRPSGQRVRAA